MRLFPQPPESAGEPGGPHTLGSRFCCTSEEAVPNLEVVIQPDLNRIVVKIYTIRAQRLGAVVGVAIFDIGGHLVGKLEFYAAAGSPAGIGAVQAARILGGIGEGHAGLDIRQDAVEIEPEAPTEGAIPVLPERVRRNRGVVARLVAPVQIAFNAGDDIVAKVKIVADLSANGPTLQ